ncbi:MAG: hypothetical protein II794_03245, partial [Oscillospiraceae bacterium]|nr:hypothetical protein [Oscillospiraceae bacterium]
TLLFSLFTLLSTSPARHFPEKREKRRESEALLRKANEKPRQRLFLFVLFALLFSLFTLLSALPPRLFPEKGEDNRQLCSAI